MSGPPPISNDRSFVDLQPHTETLPAWESNYMRGRAHCDQPSPWRVTFDTLCATHGVGRIDFLKMNIDGAEWRALPVCRQALERARSVCTAAHDFRAARG